MEVEGLRDEITTRKGKGRGDRRAGGGGGWGITVFTFSKLVINVFIFALNSAGLSPKPKGFSDFSCYKRKTNGMISSDRKKTMRGDGLNP